MEYLCHYTENKTAKIILEKMSLKLGKLYESNDPIEIKRFSSFFPYEDIKKSIKEKKKAEKELSDYLNEILRIICFSEGEIKNIEGNMDNDGEEVEIIDDIIEPAMLDLFSKKPPYYRPRTWAQYGEDNKGVCFIFNKKSLIEQVSNRISENYIFRHMRVRYADILIKGILSDMATTHVGQFCQSDYKKDIHKYLNKYYKINYFTKDIDWKDEKEYRFIAWNKINNNNYNDLFIPITNTSLIGIVSGLENNDIELFTLAKSKGIKNIMKLKFINSTILLSKGK